MKTITTNNRTLLFVEVPEDATDMECRTAVLAQCFDREYNYIATTDNIPADLGITDTLLAEHGITGRHAIIEVL